MRHVLLPVLCSLLMSAAALGQTPGPTAGPRIHAFEEAVASDPAAEAAFWLDLARTGTPIVEDSPGDPSSMLVTFVWRGDDSTRSVALLSPFSLVDMSQAEMRHIPQTSVWYRTMQVRSDAVLLYRFGPNDSMLPFERERDLRARMRGWRTDPLNPRGFTYPDGSVASLLHLPPLPDAAGSPSRMGTLERTSIPDPAGDRTQPVWTYSHGGRGGDERPAVLMIFLDGQAYLEQMHVPLMIDRLASLEPSRPVVALFIPSDPATRSGQYDCNASWSSFLARAVVPWAQSRFSVGADATDRVLVGYSLGGLAAACAAVAHPDVFGRVLAQSGSFYRSKTDEPEELARRLAESDRLPIRWSLQVGLLETAAIPSRDPSMLTATRHLRDVLVSKGYTVDYLEFFGGHEVPAWAALLPDAMAAVLRHEPVPVPSSSFSSHAGRVQTADLEKRIAGPGLISNPAPRARSRVLSKKDSGT